MNLFLKKISFDGIGLFFALLACLFLWNISYSKRAEWPGLPQASDESRALTYGFGDRQLSYRNIGLMLQSAGDEGGRVTNLKDYNYSTLRDWLWLSYKLDPAANFIPSLAAYYFGGTKKKEELRYLVDYLAKVGEENGFERWRWLAHAVYMTRFELKDQDKALELANRLAAVDQPNMPAWTKQMPAFVMAKVGQKKAAIDLMLTVAATDKDLAAEDINQTCWYINHNLREPNDGLENNELFRTICGQTPFFLPD